MLDKTEGNVIPDKADDAPSTSRPTLEQTPSAAENAVMRDAAWREQRAQNKEVRDYTWGQTAKDAWTNTLTGTIVDNAYELYQNIGAQETPLTEDEWEAKVKEAQESGLPENWLSELQDVRTVEEFQRVLARSQNHIEAGERLGSTWSSIGVGILANALDPAAWPIAAGIMTPMVRAAKASALAANASARKAVNLGLANADHVANATKAGRRTLMASSALAGGASVAATVGAVDIAGQAPTAEEYLLASLVGVALGAALGPLAAKQSTRQEAAILARAAQKAIKAQSPEARMKAMGVKPPMVEAPFALPHPDQFKVQPETPPGQPFRPKTREDVLRDPRTMEIEDITRQLETIDDELAFAHRNGAPDEIIDELRQRGIDAEARLAELDPPPVTRLVDPVELEATPAHLKNPRFISRYKGGDDAEYTIVAETSDMSGPYRVLSNGKVIARGVNHINDALGVIPRATIEELPAPPAAPQSAPNADLIRQLQHTLAELVDQADDAGAREVRQMLDLEQGFALLADDVDELGDAMAISQQRSAAQMRLHGARQRGESPEYIQALERNVKRLTDLESQAKGLPPQAEFDAQAAGAAPTPEEMVGHTFIDDAQVRAINDEDVGYSAVTGARYDKAAFVLKSRNAIRRWLGQGLYDDSVGMADKNRTSPMSAELDARQKFAKWMMPYEQAREAQFHAWARAMGINRLKQPFVRDQFYVAVGERIRGLTPKGNVPPAALDAIDKLIPHIDALGREIAEDAKNPLRDFGKVSKPLPGADEWDVKDGTYMPNRWDATKIQYAVDNGRISEPQLIRLITDAIEKANPQLNKAYLTRLGEGFARAIRNRAFGIDDDWTINFTQRDRARFVAALRRDTGLTPDEVEDVAKTVFDRKPDKAGVFGNFKRRTLMDYTHVDQRSGVGVADFLDMNVDRLFQSYAHRLSGRVALARMQLTMPKKPRFKSVMTRDPKTGNTVTTMVEDGHTGGDVFVDGIRTDEDFEAIIRASQRWEAEKGLPDYRQEGVREAEKLRWVYDRLMGRPDEAHAGKPAQAMRNIRDYNFMRLMWQVPISMMNEYVIPMAVLGVKAGTSHAPAWRRVVDSAGRSRYRNMLHDQIEAMGIGITRLHKASLRGLEHFQGNEEMALTGSRWDRVTEKLGFGTRLTAQYSGMSNLQAILEHHAAASILQRLADMADIAKAGKKFSPEDMHRWKALGLSDDMTARVVENFRHADKVDGFFFPGKLTSLNLDKWDADVSMALQHVVFRLSRKMIQQQSYGNTAIWMNRPLMQTFFQFRNFPFTAYNNHLLHNLHQRDAAAAKMFIFGTTWAAMVRAMQVKMIASMRPDADEYEEKHLNTWALAKAGFSRSTVASVSPMVIDTLLSLMDRPGMFDARSTGQPSDILGGSPSVSAYNAIHEGVGGITGSWIDNRPMSQMELRALQGLLPGATIPFMNAFGHLIKDRPVKAPRTEPLL